MINPEKIIPPKLALVLIIMAISLDWFFDPERLISDQFMWIGGTLFILGALLTVWAHNHFTKHGTPVKHSQKPTAVVSLGPYQYSRNPMYVGILVSLSGLAIMLGTWPYFLFPILMFLAFNFIYIPWEEKRMAKLFDQDFKDYLKQTRRWL